MGWSPYILGAPEQAFGSTVRRNVIAQPRVEDAPGIAATLAAVWEQALNEYDASAGTVLSAVSSLLLGAHLSDGDGVLITTYGADQEGFQRDTDFTFELTDYRNDFPAEMEALTYGVDYIEIPGTPDFVEYEPGTTHLAPGGLLESVVSRPDEGFPGFTGQVQVRAQPANTPVVTYTMSRPSAAPQTIAVSYEVTDLAPLVVNRQVSLRSRWISGQPPQGTTGFEVTFTFRPLIQLPRFRYWQPGPAVVPPLRQKQRDDGLAGSGVRAFVRNGPTSRQHSLRQGRAGTYL